jgi:hypothetical protein
MSPYMQSVVDQQQRQAQLEFERQGVFACSASGAGWRLWWLSSGCSRVLGRRGAWSSDGRHSSAWFASLHSSKLHNSLGLIAQPEWPSISPVLGNLPAFNPLLLAEQARVDQARFTELAGRESAQAAEFARAGNMEAAEAARIQAARYDDLARRQSAVEQSRQFGASQALAAEQAALGAASQMGTMAQGLGSLGQSLAGLGQQQRAADIQGAQLLETIGRDIRAEDQARLDMSYEDFVRQRDFPIQQYERMAGILRGVPVTPNVEEQRMVSYSPTQQALGAGISALGLYRGLTA